MAARSVVIVAHKYLTQPDDALVTYLKGGRAADVLHICHSFNDAPDRRSSFVWYRNGALYRRGSTRDSRGLPEPLLYLKEFWITALWILRSGVVWDAYIGMDGLCVLFGNILRLLRRVRRTIYWVIDFVPERRFASPWKEAVYHRVNAAGCRRSDEVWDLSPMMASARERFRGLPSAVYRKHRVMPYGVWLDDIPAVPYARCERDTLVFMGHLLEKQGVQLVLQALPQLLKRLPDLRFVIIGGGRYRDALERLARDTGVAERCFFLGRMEDHAELERRIASSCVAVAPYIRALDTWTAYADPGKVKEYLACGVPVVLTDVPWNARAIEQAGCGTVIEASVPAMVEAVLRAFDPATNEAMRRAARRFARSYDYASLFADAL